MKKLVENLKKKGIKTIAYLDFKTGTYTNILIWSNDIRYNICEKYKYTPEEIKRIKRVNLPLTEYYNCSLRLGHLINCQLSKRDIYGMVVDVKNGIKDNVFLKGEFEEIILNHPDAPF